MPTVVPECTHIGLDAYSVPQNLFPLPTGSIFSFATLGSALGKDYAGAIVTLFCGTLYRCEWPGIFFLTKAGKWWDDGPMVSPQTPDEASSSLTPISRESLKYRIVLRIEKRNLHTARRDHKRNYGKG